MKDEDRYPAEPWRLVDRDWNPPNAGVSESIFTVANGYVGLRGNAEEGQAGHEHGTFVNGLHETWPIQHAEDRYGYAEVGQTIVNAPDAKIIQIYIDDEPFALDVADIEHYERSLDFRRGKLRRQLMWTTPSGKRVWIVSERMASFVERHLVFMSFEVVVENADATVIFSSEVLNRQDGADDLTTPPPPTPNATFDPRRSERLSDRVLQPVEFWHEGTRCALGYRVAESHMTLSVLADHQLQTTNAWTGTTNIGPDSATQVFSVRARQGVATKLLKFVAYHSSRGTPPRELIERGGRLLDRAMKDGELGILDQQRRWLAEFWERSDVEVQADKALQQAVRWNLFTLAQAAARADSSGIPAKGLTGSGYSGHYFWDTEIYEMPFLTYTNPLMARNVLRMRERLLPSARARASQLNEAGGLFPWRTINGQEASAYYAAGTAQYHINADVAYALAKYVRATTDTAFLGRGGIDILVETARLWTTLGFWRSSDKQSFHIHGVTGPDEYTTVVNDNLYTNVMARFNLRYSAEAVRHLAEQSPLEYSRMVARLQFAEREITEWETIAEAIAVPFSNALGIHPQDADFLDREVWDLENTPLNQFPLLLHFHPLVIYRFQVLKQADVVLAHFLLPGDFSPEQKLADFNYYDPLTTGDSSLSAVAQAIVSAEVGHRALALEYFAHTLFVDLENLHENASDGVHVAATGGAWSTLVYGFGGMRDGDGNLSFDPRLPDDWDSLRFRIQWHGTRLIVKVTPQRLTVTADGPTEVEFSVRGEEYIVKPGTVLTVALAGQGPRQQSRPSLASMRHARREDGSPMTASIPIISLGSSEDAI